MKDLDFDELDRAVSSLMNDKKPSSNPESEEQNQAPSVDETKVSETISSPSLALGEDTKVSDAPTSSEDETKADSQIQKRSTGQYMDMMPMKQQAQPTTLKSHGAAAFLGQSNDTITPAAEQPPKKSAPFHDIIPPKAASGTSDATDDKSPGLMALQKSQSAPVVEDTDTQAKLEAELNEQPDQVLTPAPDTVSEPEPSPALGSLLEAGDDLSSKDSQAPLPPAEDTEAKPEKPAETSSPFLADAKVDKRPLGGVAASEQSKEPADNTAAAKNETEKSTGPLMPSEEMSTLALNGQQNENTPQTAPAPTPPEFHEDLLAVEADRQADVAPTLKPQEAPVTIEQASAAQVGPLSIAQQYKEKLSTGDQSHAPIYDTNVQPLAHPPLKKSGWWVVASIVAVIVLSVGIAAVLYFTGIL